MGASQICNKSPDPLIFCSYVRSTDYSRYGSLTQDSNYNPCLITHTLAPIMSLSPFRATDFHCQSVPPDMNIVYMLQITFLFKYVIKTALYAGMYCPSQLPYM